MVEKMASNNEQLLQKLHLDVILQRSVIIYSKS